MKKLQKFEEWLKETHPESLEEGWMKNLAVGGALLGAGMGLGRMQNGQNTPDNQDQTQQVQTQQNAPMNAWQAKKAELARRKAELQRKTQGMRSGETRTIIQGETQPQGSSSWTSPDAVD